jgi:hypothetical protein
MATDQGVNYPQAAICPTSDQHGGVEPLSTGRPHSIRKRHLDGLNGRRAARCSWAVNGSIAEHPDQSISVERLAQQVSAEESKEDRA